MFNIYESGKQLSFDELIKVKDCVARVECSGSEGYWVEIARWSYDKRKWCRWAFDKYFDLDEANWICDKLNSVWNSINASIFHSLENYES